MNKEEGALNHEGANEPNASQEPKRSRLSPVALCLRKTANTLKVPRTLMPDSTTFKAEALSPELSVTFPRLIQQIRELDEADRRDHGTLFKHFIFTDIRESAHGAKAIGSFLLAAGFDLRMGHIAKKITRDGVKVDTLGGETVFIAKPAVPHGSQSFALLQSLPLWKNPLSVQTKKRILEEFNKRPENSHGELLRIIVLDSKFKEGIDLFDVKYVHLVEPPIGASDLKQAVGRATRFCGQKGLPFTPRSGWPLHVYVYNTMLPQREPFVVTEGVEGNVRAHDLVMKHSGLDLALLNLTQELTILAIQTAVDYALNYKINNFKIEEALLEEDGVAGAVAGAVAAVAAAAAAAVPLFPVPELSADLAAFQRYRWTAPRVQNGCDAVSGEKGKAVVFSKTQEFIRHYLTPASPIKGLLAWHSVGTGKTCMAVAAATSEFEQAGYTILWVTRNALMADVYKNIFDTVCAIPFMKDGVVIPADREKQKRMLSKTWLPPISYRTFQNALEEKNELGRMLHKRNPADPLHKVFLVIDEIHKLHDGDLSAMEAADFHEIQHHIHRSYSVSGADSVRPLLMTATPITKSPEELFDILNTLIPRDADRFVPLSEFRDLYTNEEGSLTEEGRSYFQTNAKGLISYLNREFDPTTFAQPTFHTISVPLTTKPPPDISAFIEAYMSTLGLDHFIAEDIQEQDCDKPLRDALRALDGQITEAETQIRDTKEKEEKAKLKSRILDIKQLMSDAKYTHGTRRAKCILKNKEYAKTENTTRKASMIKLVRTMKDLYEREVPRDSDQVAALEKCLGYTRKARSKEDEFTKIAMQRLLPSEKKAATATAAGTGSASPKQGASASPKSVSTVASA